MEQQMDKGLGTINKHKFGFLPLFDRQEFFGPAVRIDASAFGGYTFREINDQDEEELSLYFEACDFVDDSTENLPVEDHVVGVVYLETGGTKEILARRVEDRELKDGYTVLPIIFNAAFRRDFDDILDEILDEPMYIYIEPREVFGGTILRAVRSDIFWEGDDQERFKIEMLRHYRRDYDDANPGVVINIVT
ncbi:hypothetical protein IJH74_02025 [Candidatus Saccharibacteria bacterium]|nr:hypothetical protein [Candidatus Saccharibacteria bacterium]